MQKDSDFAIDSKSMLKVLQFIFSTQVLYLALSPDGQTVCSGAADETLRLWDCFAVTEEAKKLKGGSKFAMQQPPSKINSLFSIR